MGFFDPFGGAADVGELKSDLSSLKSDVETHTNNNDIHVTASDKSNWNSKLDKNQGTENSGKVLGTNANGEVIPLNGYGFEYDEETKMLKYGTDPTTNLNQGIGLDDTLSKRGYAADAGAVGELKEDLGEYSMDFGFRTTLPKQTVGELTETSSYVSKVIDVVVGETIYITGTGSSNARLWATLNNEGKVLRAAGVNVVEENYPLTILPDEYKLVVNFRSSKPYEFRPNSVINTTREEMQKTRNNEQDIEKIKNHLKWDRKTLVCFGDSRTWYDGHSYGDRTKEELKGNICIGYQQTISKILNCNIISQGANGDTSVQICDRIKMYDFSNIDFVLFEGGVNDFVKSSSVTIGEISPIGSEFDTSSVYGAWQSAIEYVLTNYPNVQIYIDIPVTAWTSAGEFPYTVAKIKKEIAELYNIPCKDMYKESGINLVNRDNYYCDDVALTGWHLHFNDAGNKLIGEKLASFMLSN